jgi:hypothetical protein
MRVLIEPENADGDQVVIGPGQVCRIGRTAPAEFVFTGDVFLSGTHFAIDCSARILSCATWPAATAHF